MTVVMGTSSAKELALANWLVGGVSGAVGATPTPS